MEKSQLDGSDCHRRDAEAGINVNSLLNLNGLQNVLNKILADLSELKHSQKQAEAKQRTKASGESLHQLQVRIDGELRNIKSLGVRTSNAVALVRMDRAEILARKDYAEMLKESFDMNMVGRLASIHNTMLEDFRIKLASKAGLDDLNSASDSLSGMINQFKRQVEKERASSVEMDQSHQTQKHLIDQVHTIKEMLNQKLDRAELDSVKGVTGKLDRFNIFHDDVLKNIEMLKEDAEMAKKERSEMLVCIKELKSENERLKRCLRLCAREEDLTAIAKTINDIDTRLNEKGLKRDLREVQETMRRTEFRLKNQENLSFTYLTSKDSILNVMKNESNDNFDKITKSKADKEELKDSQKALESKFKKVSDENLRKLLELGEDLESLKREDIFHLERKANLSLRFIDWFSERGQNHEINMNVLDKALGNLSKQAATQSRSPFKTNY